MLFDWNHEAKEIKRLLACDSEDQPIHRCAHNEEIVDGRWGCQEFYTELREKEREELQKRSTAGQG